ncbi:RNB domain-containing ribonuclease [Streptomyces sp. OfavH-34-F]|uniref:RNB domain-containing ribonuclease n=1 Tax=Streptomyces sp. OfavH-34-F TaxID=2917760 RepID=UPI001EF36ED8|nr:RNB domain-containing ribonuclease [Streptomyces sp. OfavH-34-F]MCG7526195.1 RNB domain-containing ribonuclease [Streptomyces sp. OfavH-34-F]
MTGAAGTPLREALHALRTDAALPGDFPAEVLAEAHDAARAPELGGHRDATDIPFLTIDPSGAMDLDQAMHLERRAHGYRVRYAIADVAAFVRPGGALDAEAHRRVTTLYFPDGRIPLHPEVLSEDAASLLPGRVRPAALWEIDLDPEGRAVATRLGRALVRSRARLDYADAQRRIDAGTAEEPLALLRDIGTLREEQEVARGGISLNVPEQEITAHDGGYGLAYRAPLPAEGWNAQISLLTGMAAARVMADSGTGILRTLPVAPDGAVARLRRSAEALRIEWPHHVPYAEVVRSLDPGRADHAAFLQECTTLLRGAGYTVFDGGDLPVPAVHAAVADLYTHCTAPLRRLVDRYAAELCLAACEDRDPPEWVLAALPALPKEMAEGTRRANTVERESVDLVEAALLADRVGAVFDGYVVDVRDDAPDTGTVHIDDPAIVARVEGDAPLPLGERLRVRLAEASPGTAKALFRPV